MSHLDKALGKSGHVTPRTQDAMHQHACGGWSSICAQGAPPHLHTSLLTLPTPLHNIDAPALMPAKGLRLALQCTGRTLVRTIFLRYVVRCELQSSHQSSLHQLIGQRLTQKLCSCAEHGLRRPTADAQPWMLHHLPLLQSACLVLHTQVVWVIGALAVCRGSTVRQASGNFMETGHEPI